MIFFKPSSLRFSLKCKIKRVDLSEYSTICKILPTRRWCVFVTFYFRAWVSRFQDIESCGWTSICTRLTFQIYLFEKGKDIYSRKWLVAYVQFLLIDSWVSVAELHFNFICRKQRLHVVLQCNGIFVSRAVKFYFAYQRANPIYYKTHFGKISLN